MVLLPDMLSVPASSFSSAILLPDLAATFRNSERTPVVATTTAATAAAVAEGTVTVGGPAAFA
jgi:hypothetical protein